MTRSFGDSVAAIIGVVSDPEITEYQLTSEDKIIVLASDGVWEFLSNEDVSDIVYPYYLENNVEGAAEALVKGAIKAWLRVRKYFTW